MILEGGIKDAKMTSFLSDFQTLISFVFSLWIFNEFEKFGWQFIYYTQIILWIQSLLLKIKALAKIRNQKQKRIEKILNR